MLDSKTIETLSVNAVKNSIVTSEFLDQYISENDKEPSWDGAVYIYKNKHKKKENLKGRMPVQVKGTQCDDHSKEEISFSMAKSDLINYLYDGGCVLFVVYIGNNGLTNKIYYVELTPLKLRKLLEEAKEQDTVEFYLNDKNEVVIRKSQLSAIHTAQKAFEGTADELGLSSEDEVQALVDEFRGSNK